MTKRPGDAVSPATMTAAERRRARLRIRFAGPLQARRAGERETLVLALICALDMYTTLYWVIMGHAVEANPLLSWLFDINPMAFTLVKSGSCLPALLLAPHLAERHPKFTVWLLRGVIATYVTIYLLNVR